jgi:hypothetical protein
MAVSVGGLFHFYLNLWAVPLDPSVGRGTEVPMTKHRTITGFAAVVLLAAGVTAATMRSSSHPNSIVPAGLTSFKDLTADVNKLPHDDYDDQSLVFSKKR